MNIAIYGAGEAGQLVFDTIVSSGYGSVACFIDDDPKLQKTLNGLPIIRPDRFSETLQSTSVDEIIVAIPSASKADTALSLQACYNLQSQYKSCQTSLQ